MTPMALSPEQKLIAARELAELHKIAQERLGLHGALFLLSQWGGVDVLRPLATDAAWFAKLIEGTIRLRKVSRRLARRFYALTRALADAAPSQWDGDDYGAQIDLDTLYQELGEVLREVVDLEPGVLPGDSEPITETQPDSDGVEARVEDLERQAERTDDLQDMFDALRDLFPSDEDVDVEDFDWPDFDEADDDSFGQDYEELIREQLEDLEKEIAQAIKDREEAEEAERQADIREELERLQVEAAKKAAAAAEAATLDAGRKDIERVGVDDPAVMGWMRVTSGDPCAFCAMIASKGVVYSSYSVAKETAGGSNSEADQGDRRRSAKARADMGAIPAGLDYWHTNCRCSVVPVFTSTAHMTERDKFFSDNWGRVTKGQSNPLNAFRKWLTRQYQQGKVPQHQPYNPTKS